MENSHDMDLILRILSGEDELAHAPELERFKADPTNQQQLQEWMSILAEAGALLEEKRAWEEMPSERKNEILDKAAQVFHDTVAAGRPEGASEESRKEHTESPTIREEILLVDANHKIISAELREAVTPEGVAGWIVAADNVAPGALRVRVAEEGKGRLQAKEIAGFTIPAVSSAIISSEVLAGQDRPEQPAEDQSDVYGTFKSAWGNAGVDQHVKGDIDGYVVAQHRGVRVVAFIPKPLSDDARDQP